MYCRYCGKNLKGNAVICTGCRRPVDPIASETARADADDQGYAWSFAAMAGFVLATLALPPIGLVFGLMGLRSGARKAQGAVLVTVAIFSMLLWLAIILGL